MEIEQLIEEIEDKMELVKNSVSRKGTFRIISEEDWQKIKGKFTPKYYFDELDYLTEVDE